MRRENIQRTIHQPAPVVHPICRASDVTEWVGLLEIA
jgi:hypothetical protein